MVDSLKQSLENLEPPICPKCRVEMRWYRSDRVSETPTTIAHFFSCPNCNRTTETKSTLSVTPNVPPAKLSKPRDRFNHAA